MCTQTQAPVSRMLSGGFNGDFQPNKSLSDAWIGTNDHIIKCRNVPVLRFKSLPAGYLQ